MKIVVTGVTGLLGRALQREFATAGPSFEVIGTGWQRASDGVVRLDLRRSDDVRNFLQEVRPNAIIHAAAERRPDVSENDEGATRALNVEATRTLVEEADRLGVWLLYLSTDYVFDGSAPPYAVDARPNPLNFYGQSKLEGEDVVRGGTGGHGILRVPVLYGQVETLNESPVTVIAEVFRKTPVSARLDHWATRYPTLTDDVARTCRQLLERRQADDAVSGTFHFSGDEALTKFEMAQVIGEILGQSTDGLLPVSEPPAGAPRPQNSQLDVSRLEALGIGRRTPFRTALAEALRPFEF